MGTIFESFFRNAFNMLRVTLLLAFVAGALSAAIHPEDDGFLPSAPPAVEKILEEFYFPNSPLSPEELELIKVEYKMSDADGVAVKYRMTFQVVGQDETCKVQVFEQSVWGSTSRYLQYDLCKRFADRSEDAISPFAGGWGIMKDYAKITALLEEFYYPGSIVGAEDLELTTAQKQVVDGFNYRMSFDVVGANAQCVIEVYEHWSGATSITKDTCVAVVGDRNNNAALLGMDGGWKEADANDLDAVSLLNEVYYPQSVGEDYLTLLKVETQVVSGFNYKYTFQIGQNGVTCYAIVYSQPWTNTKRVTVDTCLM